MDGEGEIAFREIDVALYLLVEGLFDVAEGVELVADFAEVVGEAAGFLVVLYDGVIELVGILAGVSGHLATGEAVVECETFLGDFGGFVSHNGGWGR